MLMGSKEKALVMLCSMQESEINVLPLQKGFASTKTAGSYAAMQRAGRAAEDLAIRTNTEIITMIDGKVVRIKAEEIIKRCQAAKSYPGTESE